MVLLKWITLYIATKRNSRSIETTIDIYHGEYSSHIFPLLPLREIDPRTTTYWRLKRSDHEGRARANKLSAVLAGDGDSLDITSGTVAGRPRNLPIRIIIEGNYVAAGEACRGQPATYTTAWNYTLINGIIFQTGKNRPIEQLALLPGTGSRESSTTSLVLR